MSRLPSVMVPNGWYALSTLPLAAGAFGPLPSGPALAIGGLIAAVGLVVQLGERRASETRRESADELIADAPGERVPDSVVWRLEELGAEGLRRNLARALRGVVRDADGPPTLMATPIARAAVRRDRDLIGEIAARLAAVDRPIDPRGVARVRLLFVRLGSPLYDAEAPERLHRELALARATIDPRHRR